MQSQLTYKHTFKIKEVVYEVNFFWLHPDYYTKIACVSNKEEDAEIRAHFAKINELVIKRKSNLVGLLTNIENSRNYVKMNYDYTVAVKHNPLINGLINLGVDRLQILNAQVIGTWINGLEESQSMAFKSEYLDDRVNYQALIYPSGTINSHADRIKQFIIDFTQGFSSGFNVIIKRDFPHLLTKYRLQLLN